MQKFARFFSLSLLYNCTYLIDSSASNGFRLYLKHWLNGQGYRAINSKLPALNKSSSC